MLKTNTIHNGLAEELIDSIESESISLSVWSPPYFVGKSYEKDVSYYEWRWMLSTVISKHTRILKTGSFLAINIADIMCFADKFMPKIQAEKLGGNRISVTREDILRVLGENPEWNRYQIAKYLNVSEQTIDRRLKDNNIRGGKYKSQTRINLVGSMIADYAQNAGLYLYDQRIWAKDPAWENSRWHANSYRAVDEFEHVFIFWKPGITKINREKLSKEEWVEWGSRGVWKIPSVRFNDDHEAKFPVEIPRRLIRLLTEENDLVLDCFMGSGTTAIAAKKENRNYIGIEKEAKYVELAMKNLIRD